MVWLLQLANLRCPCLGLTSNELRELPFTRIKGAIRECFSISPHKWERPSRHVPLPRDCSCTSLWCPWRQELPLGLMGLKTWAERRLKFIQAPADQGGLQGCFEFLSPFSPALSGLINPSPPPVAFFLQLQHHSGLCSFLFVSISWKSCKRKQAEAGGGGGGVFTLWIKPTTPVSW